MVLYSQNVFLIILFTYCYCSKHSVEETCGHSPRVCPIKKENQCSYRPYDGSCSSPENPRCGSIGSKYGRLFPANFHGRHAFALTSDGKEFPNARLMSNELFPIKETIDDRFTLSLMQYAQLVGHDMGYTAVKGSPLGCCTPNLQFVAPPDNLECAPINVTTDSYYEQFDAPCMSFFRTDTNTKNNCSMWTSHDEQLSSVTATLDLHMIYGPLAQMVNDSRNHLRSYKDGLLKTRNVRGEEWFADAPDDLKSAMCFSVVNPKLCYGGGDPRLNQNTHLLVLQTLFLRNHNRLARKLAKVNPHWDDNRLFEEARRINVATHQRLIYYGMLLAFLGEEYLYEKKILYHTDGYVNDYDESVCPEPLNEFSQGAFRYFHSMIVDSLKLFTNNRTETGAISLKDWYNRPSIMEQHFDALVVGLHTQPPGAVDNYFVPEVKRNVLHMMKESGLDLRAIDIQRARDHGLPSYNTAREYLGFKKATTFEDFLDHIKPENIEKLKQFYRSVDDVELFTAGCYETHVHGALAGPVFHMIMGEQFLRTRVGDPFWFEGEGSGFTLDQLGEIRKTTWPVLVCDNVQNVTQMQPKSFLAISESNPLRPCEDFPPIDLSKWKENVG